jgi:NADH-quinone oxidoreductase subunit G
VFTAGEASQFMDYSVIQISDMYNFQIPRFCYHEQLTIAGNCRMCLVEVKGSAKPMIACATALGNEIQVSTISVLVKKARENILEFLLINHPLDCPICDQGGECDLQDQSMVFGSDKGRFREDKRSVSDKHKNFGPLIKTIMTRCIHCTRCVRYIDEIIGTSWIGLMGRGSDTEVGSYTSAYVASEISGNLIDLCPVGALTSKPYAFTARAWELTNVESIDILDSMCSNIRIDVRGNEIMRILPKKNNALNEEWITDKIRFSYIGMKKQRLSFPMRKVETKKFLVPCSWYDAFSLIKGLYTVNSILDRNNRKVYIFPGNLLDLFSTFMLKHFASSLGVSNINAQTIDLRYKYIFNDRISNIEYTDIFFILGTNLKKEAPLINIRIRKAQTLNGATVIYIGGCVEYSYGIRHIGITNSSFVQFLYGKTSSSIDILEKNTLSFFLGKSDLINNSVILNMWNLLEYNISNIHQKWNFNFLNLLSSDIGIAETGISITLHSRLVDGYKLRPNVIYLCGYNSLYESVYNNNSSVIYQGHHGGSFMKDVTVVLPSSAFVEKDGIYMNCEGNILIANKAISQLGHAWADELILYTLYKYLLPNTISDFNSLRSKFYLCMQSAASEQKFNDVFFLKKLTSKTYDNICYVEELDYVSLYRNYYMYDIITQTAFNFL